MPDISMCKAGPTCPKAATCYRSPVSGTVPSEYRQAWFTDTFPCQGASPPHNHRFADQFPFYYPRTVVAPPGVEPGHP